MHQDFENRFLTALDENQQKILRICSAYAENDEDKKDLFQEVIVNIWKSMPSFQGKAALGTWMFRITLNVCIRLQSKRKSKKDRFVDLENISISDIKADEGREEPYERLAQLRECIKELNDSDKAVITLYLEELPYKEISSITGLTENNVAVKVKRIKEKLLNCITEKS